MEFNRITRYGPLAGSGNRFGGAFEYDGGSSDPDNLVQIVFVAAVFDHNIASGGSAILIDGRAAQPGLDPGVQNWESGVELHVKQCTFYRGFAQVRDSIGVWNAWPFVGIIEDNDFIENIVSCAISLSSGLHSSQDASAIVAGR